MVVGGRGEHSFSSHLSNFRVAAKHSVTIRRTARMKKPFVQKLNGNPYPLLWFRGFKTHLPSPKWGRQMKICTDQKFYSAIVDQSVHITLEKWSPFLDLGGPRLVCLSSKGEGKWKVDRIKNFCKNWSQWPYYYREVFSVFLFGKCKLTMAPLQAVSDCPLHRKAGISKKTQVFLWDYCISPVIIRLILVHLILANNRTFV